MLLDPETTLTRNIALVDDLRKMPAETGWVEFKLNNSDPKVIGVRISALSNAARIVDQHAAYMIWGVADENHAIEGTTFEPSSCKVQREPLDFWLANRLKPSVHFSFKGINHPEGRVVLLEISAATTAPVEFDRIAYIRVGSATPPLSDYPERQRMLWSKLQPFAWEIGAAAQFISGDEVLKLLDYTRYFELTGQPLPDGRSSIFERLAHDQLIIPDVGAHWNITNLGAILFARELGNFNANVERKSVRFVAYSGKNRADPVRHRLNGRRGYASGFQGLIDYIHNLLPKNEHIGTALRIEHAIYPDISIRELIANALIHQDMTVSGAGPQIEMFSDRLEITNPGVPLIDPDRFIDLPPRSRNESLAAMMRRMHICEEDGTGVDKVIRAVELFQMPPPNFRAEGNAVRVTLYAPRKFADMTTEERIRACYQHAVLRYVSGDRMKNSTLRERFGIDAKNAAQASLIIRRTLDQGLIKPADADRPQAAYVPAWA